MQKEDPMPRKDFTSKGHYTQWDRQTNDRQEAWIKLNNLYLQIERGVKSVSITTANTLRVLAGTVYKLDDPMLDYWQKEFERLPNWFDY
jgi:hypothetical protein